MRDEDSYVPGETAVYQEDGGISRVRVLKNSSNLEQIAYQLQVVDVITDRSGFLKPIKTGEIFECDKKRGFPHLPFAMWELDEDNDGENA